MSVCVYALNLHVFRKHNYNVSLCLDYGEKLCLTVSVLKYDTQVRFLTTKHAKDG